MVGGRTPSCRANSLSVTGPPWISTASAEASGAERRGAGSSARSLATAFPLEIGADGDPDLGSTLTRIHLLFVLLAPVPWWWAALSLAGRWRQPRWRGLASASALAAVALLVLTGLGMARAWPEVPGLLQRASFLVFLGWYAVAACMLPVPAPALADR